MKIMLCLDGSPSSALVSKALQTRRLDANTKLRIVTAVEEAESRFFLFGPKQSNYLNEVERASAQRCQSEIRNELERVVPGIRVEQEIAIGPAKQALLNAAESWNSDLIIIGSRGIRRDDPLSLGSVSQAVLEHANCPVLIARRISAEEQSVNILLPIDHSPYSTAAAEWALKQVWSKTPKFTLISVVPPMPKGYAYETDVHHAAAFLHEYEQMERASKALLHQWVAKFESKFGPNSASAKLVCGDPSNEILTAVLEHPNTMVIMGSHGHTALKRFLLGSVSRSVSLYANCCVEVVRF